MKLRELVNDLGAAFVAAVTPKGRAGQERLDAYWAEGEGAAKIKWAVPCAFCRCLEHVGKATAGKMPVSRLKGHCANLEKKATGHYPNPEHSRTHHCPC